MARALGTVVVDRMRSANTQHAEEVCLHGLMEAAFSHDDEDKEDIP